MATEHTWHVLGRVANVVGVLVAIGAVGIIGWYIAMATHLVNRPPTGF